MAHQPEAIDPLPGVPGRRSPLIIGHRGASAVAPENTIASFERALHDGADGIEFDVRLARDGVPVVIHDATLRRTALRDGNVADLSSTELSEIDVGTWFNLRYPAAARPSYTLATVPTLVQVMDLFRQGGALLYLEMKCEAGESGALAAEVAKLILSRSLLDRVVVESFALDSLLEIKRITPGIRTAALFEPRFSRPVSVWRKMRMIELALSARADSIALHRALATPRVTEEARSRGMDIVVWTVDSPAWIERARRYRVHSIITNNPALMRARRDAILAL